jgi:DNA polymerase III alpha subunit
MWFHGRRPWTERQRLQEEKAALGFYFSGHLFDAAAAALRRGATHGAWSLGGLGTVA